MVRRREICRLRAAVKTEPGWLAETLHSSAWRAGWDHYSVWRSLAHCYTPLSSVQTTSKLWAQQRGPPSGRNLALSCSLLPSVLGVSGTFKLGSSIRHGTCATPNLSTSQAPPGLWTQCGKDVLCFYMRNKSTVEGLFITCSNNQNIKYLARIIIIHFHHPFPPQNRLIIWK